MSQDQSLEAIRARAKAVADATSPKFTPTQAERDVAALLEILDSQRNAVLGAAARAITITLNHLKE